MRISIGMAIILLTGMLLAACGSDNDTSYETAQPTGPEIHDVTITIGVISDLTGPGAVAHQNINLALQDLAEYFNQGKLDPGTKIELSFYDGAGDPSNDIPGYLFLKEGGADVIFSAQPSTGITLKRRVDEDQMVMFSASGDAEAILPPGYVFALSTLPQYEAYSLLKWIAENDWDYRSKGPAKIGGAGWNNSYDDQFMTAMEDYCDAHPGQFEWVGGHLAPHGTFTWGPEVQALKGADYVYPCSILVNFVSEYRKAGYSAKIIGAGIHTAFFGLVDDAQLWDELDGGIFLMASTWWTDEGELMTLTRKLLYENHANDAEAIIREGAGYATLISFHTMFDILTRAFETAGPNNFGSQAIYDAAQKYSLELGGTTRFSFSETKRDGTDEYKVYIVDETRNDMFAAEEKWIPVTREP